MKAYDITKLIAELREATMYINKTYYFVGCFGAPVGVATGSTAIGLHTTKLIYRTRIAGRRQVTVRFMNKKIVKALQIV